MGFMRLLPRPGNRSELSARTRWRRRPGLRPEPVLTAVPEPEPRPDLEGRAVTRVIALANQKGGVAKTTTTLNLGVAFHEQGHRVLIIDLDPQGNLTMSQGMNPDAIERSMFDVLVHRIPISDVIEHREVEIAVASIDLAGAELALSSMIGRERALEKALVEVRRSVRLHPHRHAALTRPAHDQRVRRGHRGDRPGAVRVPRCAASCSWRTRSRWCAKT